MTASVEPPASGQPAIEPPSIEAPSIKPPSIEARPESRTVHGRVLVDEFSWLRAANWQDVLRDPTQLPPEIASVLAAENRFADAWLAGGDGLRRQLVSEMRGRILEDDSSVPLVDGKWFYHRRYRTGGQHPLICRTLGAAGVEEVLLDGEAEAAGRAFFSLGEAIASPDGALLAWSADTAGSELHTITVRDLATGTDRGETVAETDGSLVWMADGTGFYYVHVDGNHRTCRVYRHMLGEAADTLVFAEDDPAWFVGLHRCVSGAFAVIRVSDHAATECHLVDLGRPDAAPRLVAARSPDHRYEITHHDQRLFILTNCDGAVDFKIVTAPLAAPEKENWRDVVPHWAGRLITAIDVFPSHLVRLEREAGLPRIVRRHLTTGREEEVAFEEEAYGLALDRRTMFASPLLRFTYQSMTTPRETYELDLSSGERRLLKRQLIPSGHDPAAYVTRRLFARAEDGTPIPVTLLHQRGLHLDGSAPLLLYGYGAYGHALPANFSGNALSLVDRGFVYAIAHVRGGTENGWAWYLDGKLENKRNSFTDFLAVAHHLVDIGYTSAGRIVAQGGSAGGMLMGAVANLEPDLFAGIVAAVPFVDVLSTMLDADLPLTPPEWVEWGDPITDPEAFERIASYSPYDNIGRQAYPPILALAGLTDPRVTYWEPAKWIAKLRAIGGGGPFLLKTNMDAGHGGSAGRFSRLDEIAEQYAFAISCVSGGFAGARAVRDQLSMKDLSSAIDAKR